MLVTKIIMNTKHKTQKRTPKRPMWSWDHDPLRPSIQGRNAVNYSALALHPTLGHANVQPVDP